MPSKRNVCFRHKNTLCYIICVYCIYPLPIGDRAASFYKADVAYLSKGKTDY